MRLRKEKTFFLKFFGEFCDLVKKLGMSYKLRNDHYVSIKANKQYMYLAKE